MMLLTFIMLMLLLMIRLRLLALLLTRLCAAGLGVADVFWVE
jgi:hypothetical protein